MRRDAELAAALWSQEMQQQQQAEERERLLQHQRSQAPTHPPSATHDEPVSSPTGRAQATTSVTMSSPPTSPSKRGPPWPAATTGSLVDHNDNGSPAAAAAAALTPPPPPLARGAGGALYHALMDPSSTSTSASPATPVVSAGLAGLGSALFTLLGRTPPASREGVSAATAAAAATATATAVTPASALPRSLPRTPQQGILSSPATMTTMLAGGTPVEAAAAGSPAPYMRPLSERELETIQGCSAAISRWPGGAAVLVEAGRMAQSFIRVHRQVWALS